MSHIKFTNCMASRRAASYSVERTGAGEQRTMDDQWSEWEDRGGNKTGESG